MHLIFLFMGLRELIENAEQLHPIIQDHNVMLISSVTECFLMVNMKE